MNQIKLYFDEDAMHSRLVKSLWSRGVTVVTVMDAGLTEKTDEEQLSFATERERSTSPISIAPLSFAPPAALTFTVARPDAVPSGTR